MVSRLQQSETISIVDDGALYQYVLLHAETETIREDSQKLRGIVDRLLKSVRSLKGDELVNAVGEIVKLEQVIAKHTTQLRQGHMALRQYLVEFGMTPSSRTRVKISKKDKPQSKLLSFTGGRAKDPATA
jgi:hypothetical protein